jgi:hypothetical protein
MPRGDRRGPMGNGPMTGRGAGLCGGFGMPGHMNAGGRGDPGAEFGRRAGCGRGGFGGGGHGWRNRYFATGLPGWMHSGQEVIDTGPEMARQALKARMEALQAELDIMKQHLERLDKSSGEAAL